MLSPLTRCALPRNELSIKYPPPGKAPTFITHLFLHFPSLAHALFPWSQRGRFRLRYSSVVKFLPSMSEALGSVPSVRKERQYGREEGGGKQARDEEE